MPNRSLSGVVSSPSRVVAATQREPRQVDLHRPGRRPLADDQVELKILHRRVEDFLDGRIEPVDLVDEQNIAVFEIGQKGCEIPGLGDHRAGSRAEIDAQFLGHDLRQRGLAEPRRSDEQHVVQRLGPSLGRFENTFRLARASAWPVNSSRVCGRRVVSTSSPRLSGEIRRSGSLMPEAPYQGQIGRPCGRTSSSFHIHSRC